MVDEVKKLAAVMVELAKTGKDPMLSLAEMVKRAERVLQKIDGLKVRFDELERMAHTPLLQQSSQARTAA